jgi:hypothetical protein
MFLRPTAILILWMGAFADKAHAPITYTDVTGASGIRFRNNNSTTSEKYLIEAMTVGAAVFDYDNEGWPDIFLVNGARIYAGQHDNEARDKSAPEFWNRLYHNNRDGTFTDMTEKAGVRGNGFGMGFERECGERGKSAVKAGFAGNSALIQRGLLLAEACHRRWS